MTADEIAEVLELEPWLRWFVEPGDENINDVRVRFLIAQNIAVRELRAHGEEVEVRFSRRGLLTTSYVPDRADQGVQS
jgi:hypothetical protein